MISTFKCVALRGRISIPQCVSLYTLGKNPAGEADRLRTAHCRGCVIGEAHARGETPAQWPEGHRSSAAPPRRTDTPRSSRRRLPHTTRTS